MIRIDPHALYTRADLTTMLDGSGVDVDHFIARLRPRKVFKCLFFGRDLLQALETVPALSDRSNQSNEPAMPAAKNKGNRRRRGIKNGNLGPLEQIIKGES